MRRSEALTAVAFGLPGLSLAVAGAFHPHGLNYDSAQRWFLLHIAGLAVFPLVGVALAALMGRRRDVLAWAVRITAYLYATFYTALDVISGIAAGYVTRQLGPDTPRPDEVRLLFRIGSPLGRDRLLGPTGLLRTRCGRPAASPRAPRSPRRSARARRVAGARRPHLLACGYDRHGPDRARDGLAGRARDQIKGPPVAGRGNHVAGRPVIVGAQTYSAPSASRSMPTLIAGTTVA